MPELLIDTNIYALAMKGDPEVTPVLHRCHKIGICAISIGELLSGFKGGSKEKKTERNWNIFWTRHEFFFTRLTKVLLNFIASF